MILKRSYPFIDENSKVPKYQQVVDTIVSEIEMGVVKVGEKIPSINETSIEYYLSRDTVEKAYNVLRKRGIVTSVRGKGFYISSSGNNHARRILMVINKLSEHKKTIYNAFAKKVGPGYSIDLQVHNSDEKMLEKIIMENLGKYDYYIIMPHLCVETENIRAAINKIPKEKLILLNKDMNGITGEYACVFEDFELDIHQALHTGIEKLRKYKKLVLVFPTESHYCNGIVQGFINFCQAENFDYEVVERAALRTPQMKELYVVIEEADLVEVIKRAIAKNLKLGKTFGVITYNDTPFKEILSGGISVLSTDFVKMGETLSDMIHEHSWKKVKNPFRLILRNSV